MVARIEDIREWVRNIPDPEIPVVSIGDLGILRDVEVNDAVVVSLAPTYSGCPATEAIEKSVVDELTARGVEGVEIRRVLSPAWTTDWISDEGRAKLKAYGIAPPSAEGSKRDLLNKNRPVACPRCDSTETVCVSEFGSTACKAAYRCTSCLEPFEYFKCL